MAYDLSAIHPDLQAVVKKIPPMRFNRYTVRVLQMLTRLMPSRDITDDVVVSNTKIQRGEGNGDMLLRIYKPASQTGPAPVLLWIHGGGLIIGHPKMDDAYLTRLVKDLGIVAVSVDYRLAPQHPYPAAIDDCYTALTWVDAHAGELGIDRSRIAVGGASAGGGLAASLAQMAHDKDGAKPVFQLLVYPMLDDRSAPDANPPHGKFYVWTKADNRFGWGSYLQQPAGMDSVPPYAVPARREDLSGLPPAWIGVGSLDLFHAENSAYADTLRRSGVACELVVIDRAFHGFDQFDISVPVVAGFYRSQVDALRRSLLSD